MAQVAANKRHSTSDTIFCLPKPNNVKIENSDSLLKNHVRKSYTSLLYRHSMILLYRQNFSMLYWSLILLYQNSVWGTPLIMLYGGLILLNGSLIMLNGSLIMLYSQLIAIEQNQAMMEC